MFDNPNAFLKIFAILIIVALFIYRIQLLALIISAFDSRGKKKEDYRTDAQVNEYLAQNNSNSLNEPIVDHKRREIVPPIFHLLKVSNADNYISLYFSNRGGNIYNVSVKSSETQKASIEPNDKILNKTSGCIKFSTDNDHDKDISFELFYSDDFNPISMRRYKYFFADKKIEESN